MRSRLHVAAVILAGVVPFFSACSDGAISTNGKFLVVTTVAPLTDIAKNVAGTAAVVQGIVPEGVDSHTFEPTPESARLLVRADLIVLNGLHLEDPTLRLAQANHKDGTVIYLLGEHTLKPDQYVYDFSFPRTGGKPNPHLWMDVKLAMRYTELIRDQLAEADPAHASTYRANAAGYLTVLGKLDQAVQQAIDTIPPDNRKLLTYHDSFAYPARDYGFTVIGAVQPSDFSEPSAGEVADLIDQIRATHVPAIFGSEVFPSPVLKQIADETGVKYEASLRDDDLPGDPGAADHSYVGLIKYDYTTIADDLGGDGSALAWVAFTNRYD